METVINIKGIYNNGVVTLTETPPPIPENESVEVVVAFSQLNHSNDQNSFKPRKAGFGKGSVIYIAPDFDEPLDELKDYM